MVEIQENLVEYGKQVQKMNITALMPMKGVSERVPNKNMRSFGGVPLYAVMMEKLAASRYVDHICVNTDSEIIGADIATRFPEVLVHKRPVELLGHDVPMNHIIEYDLSKLEGEWFLQTHSTNPLLTTQTLDQAIETFMEKVDLYDSVFSVSRFQTRLYWQDGRAVNHDPAVLLKTQDLPPIYEENSCFYLFSRHSFAAAGQKRIGNKPWMFEIPRLEAIDIDEPEDFVLAEFMYQFTKQ
jgi:N-acylneuraminate cytidylyltransferase